MKTKLLLAITACDEYASFGGDEALTTVDSVTITADPGGWGEILDLNYTTGDTNSDITCSLISPSSGELRQITNLTIASNGQTGFASGPQTYRMGFFVADPGDYSVRCKTADGKSAV